MTDTEPMTPEKWSGMDNAECFGYNVSAYPKRAQTFALETGRPRATSRLRVLGKPRRATTCALTARSL